MVSPNPVIENEIKSAVSLPGGGIRQSTIAMKKEEGQKRRVGDEKGQDGCSPICQPCQSRMPRVSIDEETPKQLSRSIAPSNRSSDLARVSDMAPRMTELLYFNAAVFEE
jgi:hypothetical protein